MLTVELRGDRRDSVRRELADSPAKEVVLVGEVEVHRASPPAAALVRERGTKRSGDSTDVWRQQEAT